ncbi:MAG: hypothetical protein QOJ79_2262 [Actinomycetota bacterium]|jgi:hypothetical protein|nr:hypothetical protein [Actinomycetota bacterium]
MKPRTLCLVAVAVVASALTAPLAQAKPAAKPVAITQYLHGTQQYGELQKPAGQGDYAVMDGKAPAGTSARSSGVTNYVGGPNTECAGNTLFPVWVGAVDGTPTGNATVDLFLQTAGSGSFEVRLFSNVGEQLCNADYPGTIGSETVTFTSGQDKATVVLKNINPKHKPVGSLMLQITPVLSAPPYVARVQYDATAANSRITFSCLPKAGKTSC